LWVVNPTRKARVATISLSADAGSFVSAEDVWQGGRLSVKDNSLEVRVPERDAAVLRLKGK
jgi:hypothetical protein